MAHPWRGGPYECTSLVGQVAGSQGSHSHVYQQMLEEVLDLMGSLNFQGNTQRVASSHFKSAEAEFREAESLVQGHTARTWQSQSLTPGSVDPKAHVLSLNFYKV